ncbi:MAG: PAS domain S-box protein [Anaerolineales bacterium]|nr:PAS domain S-box protein [Anaerolineales bacterium]
MQKPLAVLIVEDSESDAQLIVRALKKAGYKLTFERVETAEQMQTALKIHAWDIIISDQNLPQFDSYSALSLLREEGLDIPFIVVSGTIGEEAAVAMMKAGAHDFLMKDNLTRLVPAVERELEYAEIRRERKQIESTYRTLTENSIQGVAIFQRQKMVFANPALSRINGYTNKELMAMSAEQIIAMTHPDDLAISQERVKKRTAGETVSPNIEVRILKKDGSIGWVQVFNDQIEYEGQPAILSTLIDITESKQAKDELHTSEKRFRALIENSLDDISLLAADGTLIWESPSVIRNLDYAPDEFVGRNMFELMHPDDVDYMSNLYKQLIQEPASRQTGSFRLRRNDGAWRWFEAIATNMLNEPSVQAIVINYRDVTERKDSEDRIRESEDRYRDLVENSQDLICTHDLEGIILTANPASARILGYKLNELIGKNLHDFIAPEVKEHFKYYISRLRRRGSASGVLLVQTKSGERRVWEYQNTVRSEGVAEPVVRGMARDITERKQAEETLNKTRGDYQRLFDRANDVIIIFEPEEEIILQVNAAACATYGFSRSELIGMSLKKLTMNIEEGESQIRDTLKSGSYSDFESIHINKNGDKIYFLINASVVEYQNKEAILSINHDITERKQVEKTLNTSEARYRSLFEDSPIALWEEDFSAVKQHLEALRKQGITNFQEYFKLHPQKVIEFASLVKVLDINKAAIKLFGAHKKDDLLKNIAELSKDEPIEQFQNELVNIAEGKTSFGWEGIIKTLDGKTNNIDLSWRAAPDPENSLSRVIVSMIDITERKQIEAALVHSEQAHRTLFENVPVGLYRTSIDGRMLDANPTLVKMFGYPDRESLLAVKVKDLYADPAIMKKFNDGIVRIDIISSMEAEFLKKDGATFWLEDHVKVIRDEAGNPLFFEGSLIDITERKRSEEALQESEERFRSLFTRMMDGVYRSKHEGKFVDVNPAMVNMFGYSSREEMLAVDIKNELYFEPEERGSHILDTGQEEMDIYRMRRKDGSEIWVEDHGSYVHDEQGKIIYHEGILRDITERKHADQILAESEARFRQAIAAADAIPYSLDYAADYYTFIGEGIVKLTGYVLEEITPALLDTLIVESVMHGRFEGMSLSEAVSLVREGESGIFWRCDHLIRTRLGEERWISDSSIQVLDEKGMPKGSIGIIQDITERKQIEAAAREGEARYRSLFEDSPVSLWEEDFSAIKLRLDMLRDEGVKDFRVYFKTHPQVIRECAALVKILDVNKATLKLFGAKTKDDLTQILSHFTDNDPTELFENELISIAQGKSQFEWEGVSQTLDGRRIIIKLSLSVMPGYEANLSKVIISMIDITARMQAEKAVRESEQRYRGLFEDMPIAIWEEDFSDVKKYLDSMKEQGITDLRAYFESNPEALRECAAMIKILDINQTALKMYHAESKDALLKILDQGLSDGELEHVIDDLVAIAEGKTSQNWEGTDETLLGEPIEISLSWSVAPGYEADFSRVIVTTTDITDRKNREREQEALASVTQVLNQSLDLDVLLQNLLDAALHAIPAAEKGAILLLDADNFLRIRALSGYLDPRIHTASFPSTSGYSARAVRELQPLIIADARADAPTRYNQDIEEMGAVQSAIVAPLMVNGRAIGAIALDNASRKEAFSQGELTTLSTFASSAALVIQNTRLFEETRQRVAELELLYESGLAISQLLNPKEIGQKIIDLLEQKMNWHHTAIRLYNTADETLELLAFHQPDIKSDAERLAVETRFKSMISHTGQGLTGWVIQHGETVRTGDLINDNRYIETFEGLHSGLYVPIKAGDRIIGVISIESEEENAFSKSDEQLTTILATQAASIFENARLYEDTIQRSAELEQRVAERTAQIEVTKRRLELATHAGQIGVWEYNPRENKVIWDERMHMIHQVPAGEFDGTSQTWAQLIHPDDIEQSQINRQLAVTKNLLMNNEHRIIWPDGSVRNIMTSAATADAPDGTPDRIIGINMDITERKQIEQSLRESETYARLLFDAVPDPVSVTEDNGLIVDVNEVFEKQYNLSRADIRGKHMDQLGIYPEAELEKREKYLSEILRGEPADPVELEFYVPGDRVHTLELHSYLLKVNDRQLVLNTTHDITAYKKAEEAQRIAKVEIERALRIKNEFLANMSHELRTPLNSILGISESLEEQIAGNLNEKQLKYIGIVRESGRHLLELINDILDLSKIEAGRMELDIQQISVDALCQSSLRMIKELSQKKSLNVSFKVKGNIEVILADQRRLKQSIVNLLSNAVKFTPEGKEIGLEVSGNTKTNQVEITVWDQGVGIAQDDIKRLFKPFVQLDAGLAREYQGTGLGLALVAQMVNLHGGQVRVESTVEKGSRFIITLPWLSSEHTQRADIVDELSLPTPKPPEKRNGRILLVEDTDVVVQLISEYLRYKGYEVILAHDGAHAIQLATQEHPDLILMDVMMPIMDGLEATQRIRTIKTLKNTPIIALTALAMSGDSERCLAAGMNDYISKPIQMQNLADMIEKYLGPTRDEINEQ